jgi:hypothetical protein
MLEPEWTVSPGKSMKTGWRVRFEPSRKRTQHCAFPFLAVVCSELCTARQILSSAIFRLVNFWTGSTPGRLFQIATSCLSGQEPAFCSHSSKLVMGSESGLFTSAPDNAWMDPSLVS